MDPKIIELANSLKNSWGKMKPSKELQIKKKPVDWAREEGIIILDPDGWRGEDAPAFNEPITKEEYLKRRTNSTCNFKNQFNNIKH